MPLKDLEKLTVVKLRTELTNRGLDAKGNKPFLVERLRAALEQEEKLGVIHSSFVKASDDEEHTGNNSNSGDTDTIGDMDDEAADAVPVSQDSDDADGVAAEPVPEQVAEVAKQNGEDSVVDHNAAASPINATISAEVETAAGEVSFSQASAGPDDSIMAVYGGKDETFMEEDSVLEQVDTAAPADEIREGEEEEAEVSEGFKSEEQSQDVPEVNGTERVEHPTEEELMKQEDDLLAATEDETAEASADLPVSEEELLASHEEGAPAASQSPERMEPDNVQDKQEGEGQNVDEAMITEQADSGEKGIKRPRERSPSPEATAVAKGESSASSTPPVEDEPEWDPNTVVLDWYNSDLNLVISKTDFLSAAPLTDGGFAYMWAGAKATYGFLSGKLCYQVKIVDNLAVDHLGDTEQDKNVVRVGWSIDSASLQLGEDEFSYGYGATGKISENCQFKDYGTPFTLNDVVGVYADFGDEQAETVEISFTVNEKCHGTAFSVAKEKLNGRPLFPHVITKNCRFQVNFGQLEEPWFQPLEGFKWITSAAPGAAPDVADADNAEPAPAPTAVRGSIAPATKQECSMIMMCGLPGAGKTTWANKYKLDNAEHKFNILGTNAFLDKMRVNGLARRNNYTGRWDTLIEKCTRCLNILLEMAAKRRRNYILDQTNVYATAQKRKMSFFTGFNRRAVVIVPKDEDFKARVDKRTKQEGSDVPETAVMEMKANFKLPSVDDTFSHIDFAELEREEAQKLIDKYSAEAKAAGHGQTPNKKPRQNGGGGGNRGHKNDRDSGGGNRRHGGRDRHRDSRGSNGHRSPRAYRDHRDRPSRPPLPHPSSNWSRGGGGGGGGGGGRGAPGGGGGGRGGGGWVNRGPPPPPMARNGPYMQRRGPPLPPPPPNRGGGWSAMAPADRSYGGARPDRGGGGAPPPRPYDDRRNDRPLYSQAPRRDGPSPWITPPSIVSASPVGGHNRSPWSSQPWSNSTSSYGQQQQQPQQQSSYGSSLYGSGGGGGSSSYADQSRSDGYSSLSSRADSYGSSSSSALASRNYGGTPTRTVSSGGTGYSTLAGPVRSSGGGGFSVGLGGASAVPSGPVRTNYAAPVGAGVGPGNRSSGYSSVPAVAPRTTGYATQQPGRPAQSYAPLTPAVRTTSYGTGGGGGSNSWAQQQTPAAGGYQYPYNPNNHSAYSGGK